MHNELQVKFFKYINGISIIVIFNNHYHLINKQKYKYNKKKQLFIINNIGIFKINHIFL